MTRLHCTPILLFAFAWCVGHQVLAHAGPERHPVESDLAEVERTTQIHVHAAETRMQAQFTEMNASITSLERQFDDIARGATDMYQMEMLAQQQEDMISLEMRIKTAVTFGAVLMAILVGTLAYVGYLVREHREYIQKRLAERSRRRNKKQAV